MIKIYFTLSLLFIFTACGGSPRNDTQNHLTDEGKSSNLLNPNAKQEVPKIQKTLTLYIHGFSKSGYKKAGVYGDDLYDETLDSIVKMTGYATMSHYTDKDTNIIAMAPYYGDTAPRYYTQKDINDISSAGKGIPRYALIMAKYAKHLMKSSGANTLNIISVSMGSLVTRYLIEKDLEQLSSAKKIQKWLSFEGVIQGNVAASSSNLLNTVEIFDKQAPEVDQMDYGWIRRHLDMQNPYYHDIQVGFESSTDDDASNGALSLWLLFNGNFRANDGVQLVEDTFINDPRYAHTYFHDNHYTLADNTAAWGYAAIFLNAKKHVRLTLLDATLLSAPRSRVSFESHLFAPKAQQKWGFNRAIDERVIAGSNLARFRYSDGENKTLNQVLFNSYVLEEESSITLQLQPSGQTLVTKEIPVKEGVYPLQGSTWSARVKVEVLD